MALIVLCINSPNLLLELVLLSNGFVLTLKAKRVSNKDPDQPSEQSHGCWFALFAFAYFYREE